ncbi:MAG: B12-binding domain-containing radical SAM protein [Bacteriovoracaceae bacterium]|jgi:anaerobic magnesium-protoporphyrin IX monomethyl ester cyclase|nr:B12-binding domain-containing radical SAM protein [Bacteriovoracaceae bacterium]
MGQTYNTIKKIALVQTTRLGTSRPDVGLAICTLKTFLETHSDSDYEILTCDSNEFLNDYTETKFDLVALSSVSNQYGVAKNIVKIVKEKFPDTVTIIGGAHITALPSSLDQNFDFGVVGEGEFSFLEFVESVNSGKDNEQIGQIPGVFGRRNGRIVMGQPRSLMEDLDVIPAPDLGYFNRNRSIPAIFSARGCPYKCDFCTNYQTWTREVRRPTPGKLISDIRHIADSLDDVRVIVFRDDIAFVNVNYLKDCISYAQNNDPEILKIPKVGYAQVSTMNKMMVKSLQEFGFTKVAIGFESGSEKIIQVLKAGSATVAKNQKSIDLCHDAGLGISGNFIIGVPEEEEIDLVQTYEFILKNIRSGKLGFGSTSILTPFPGTRYWDLFRAKEDFTVDNFEWTRLDEPGFMTYYEDTKGKGTVREWWKVREDAGYSYLGGINVDSFIDIMQEFEPQIIEETAAFRAADRHY